MPKTKAQNVLFTLLMALVMVYAMICYNIALATGGLTHAAFRMAFHELVIMWPAAVLLELLVVERLAQALAFRAVRPGRDHPLLVTAVLCSVIVCLMCPSMSLIATALFKRPASDGVAVWLQTTALNFPMALCWQLFFAGPLVRWIFRTLTRGREA